MCLVLSKRIEAQQKLMKEYTNTGDDKGQECSNRSDQDIDNTSTDFSEGLKRMCHLYMGIHPIMY